MSDEKDYSKIRKVGIIDECVCAVTHNNVRAGEEILRRVPLSKQTNMANGIYSKEEMATYVAQIKEVRDFNNMIESHMVQLEPSKRWLFNTTYRDGKPFNLAFNKFWDELDIEAVKAYKVPEPLTKEQKAELKAAKALDRVGDAVNKEASKK